MPNIRTSRHLRPITSLLGSEGKGKSLLFLTRGIISGEPMKKWCRGFDLENREIAIVSCSWRHFYKSEVAKNSSFPLCSNVQTFLFDPASKEESFEGTIFQLRSIPLFFKRSDRQNPWKLFSRELHRRENFSITIPVAISSQSDNKSSAQYAARHLIPFSMVCTRIIRGESRRWLIIDSAPVRWIRIIGWDLFPKSKRVNVIETGS